MTLADLAIDKGMTGLLIMLGLLPVLAAIFGYESNARRLRIAVFGAALLTTLYLIMVGIILETGLYSRSTGMEGIALIVLPVPFLLSASVAALCYLAARAFARLP